MNQILTQDQAQAVATAISMMETVGGRITKISFDGGSTRIRIRGNEAIIVMRVGEQGKILAQRSYGDLAYFVSQHQESSESTFAELLDTGDQYDCIRCGKDSGRLFRPRMFLCPTCGNKRCPKASDHRLDCTGSNEPGQAGSVYA